MHRIQSQKTRIFMALALLLTLAAGLALAETSVIGTDTSFTMSFDDLTTAKGHVMELKAGDTLDISTRITGGSVAIVIKNDETGDVLYTSSESTTPGSTLEVPASGRYRITVTGDHAAGSVWISVPSGTPASTEETENAMPARREIIQSKLGYVLDCDVDYFQYTPGDDIDEYLPRDIGLKNGEISFSIRRASGTAKSHRDALVDQTEAEGTTYTSESSVTIDHRDAQSVLLKSGAEGEMQYHRYTFVDVGDSAVIIESVYFDGAEGAAERMENMIQSIQFTF